MNPAMPARLLLCALVCISQLVSILGADAMPSWHPHKRMRREVAEESEPVVSSASSDNSSPGSGVWSLEAGISAADKKQEEISIQNIYKGSVNVSQDEFLDAIREHNKGLKPVGGGCLGKVKIFNIGLPRTGTLSLVEVLKQNGMGQRACHQFPDWAWSDVNAFIKDPKAKAKSVRNGISKCDHIGDIPTYGMVDSLMAAYPSARFVMSTRQLDTWLSSTEKLLAFWSRRLRKDYGAFHQWFYQTKGPDWEKPAWTDGYRRHHEHALKVLGDRLLMLPVEMPNDEKLVALTSFLGCKVNAKIKYAKKHVGNKWRCKPSKNTPKC